MDIYSIEAGDLVNYPEHMSIVINTHGCSAGCEYCHNKDIHNGKTFINLSPSVIAEEIGKQAKDILTKYVVITGGEPTEQVDLLTLVMQLNARGFRVKLDTNSCHSTVALLTGGLSYVALDVKPFTQTFLLYNIVHCIISKTKFELRVTMFDEERLLHKIRRAINYTLYARRHLKHAQLVNIYLQRCNYDSQKVIPYDRIVSIKETLEKEFKFYIGKDINILIR